jgi:hypothetical protein
MLKDLLLVLIAITLGTAACQKDNDSPQPAAITPAQEAALNMVFRYYSPDESRGINYLADKPAGELLPDRLTVKLTGPGSTDQIEFVLTRSRQKPGLVGTYTLASQPDPGQGDVQVTYQRAGATDSRRNGMSSTANRLEGSFTITSYDAGRHLISGSYTCSAPGTKDPFVFLTNGFTADTRRDGDLRVYGTFTEVPLQ